MNDVYDKIIIGAGLYGLYAALYCGKKGERILVLERDTQAFSRATYINQARVHMGYHYPRSLSTAIKSAQYFQRFLQDYDFCIKEDFNQIYATSSHYSWTDAKEFVEFCRRADIRCEEVSLRKFFNQGVCDGAFLTTEYTYDAHILRDYFIKQTDAMKNVKIAYEVLPEEIRADGDDWSVCVRGNQVFKTPFILNATYAGVNNIHSLIGADPFKIKYELCEIILCETNDALSTVGITVMDGPFFSIMPFGKTGLHSLTSVTFTPHQTSFDSQPTFDCQGHCRGRCSPSSLFNCNECEAKPKSAWPFMGQLARKYIKPEYEFKYKESLFSMKPILQASEVDDSRPTVIRQVSDSPKMVSVLSGKINTVYDLDPFLD